MPRPQKMFPLLVACFIFFTGVFFLINALFDTDLVTVESAADYRLVSIAVLLTAVGLVYIYLNLAGKLKKEGPTVAEVRTDAVSGLKSETLLADIARNDPNPEVRRTAALRLEEIKD